MQAVILAGLVLLAIVIVFAALDRRTFRNVLIYFAVAILFVVLTVLYILHG